MDLNTIFLVIIISINILVFILVVGTLFEFNKLDKEQFKFYIIGLFFYGLTVFCFFLEFILFPPLNDFEYVILDSGLSISPLIGMFYFIKGTEKLAKQENPGFKKNELLYNLYFYFTIITIFLVYVVYVSFVALSKTIYEILHVISFVFYAIIVVLALILLLEYKQNFSAIIDKIITQYILAIVLLIVAGLIITEALEPIRADKIIFTDLSNLRTGIATIGAFIIFIPFIICYRSVSKFRKLLSG